MTQFIKLTQTQTQLIVNVNHIVALTQGDKHTHVELVNGRSVAVKETIDAIQKLLNRAASVNGGGPGVI